MPLSTWRQRRSARAWYCPRLVTHLPLAIHDVAQHHRTLVGTLHFSFRQNRCRLRHEATRLANRLVVRTKQKNPSFLSLAHRDISESSGPILTDGFHP